MEQLVPSYRVLTCLERLSLVWACWACWVCCVSVRPCCPAALLRRVWGWVLGACSSVEQEALDELSSTEAACQGEIHLQLDSVTHISKQRYSIRVKVRLFYYNVHILQKMISNYSIVFLSWWYSNVLRVNHYKMMRFWMCENVIQYT